MSTSVPIVLDERREKKDGTCPLVLRIIHNRKSTAIPLGYSLPSKDWDEKKRMVKKSSTLVSSVTRLNNLLAKRQTDAMDMVTRLEDEGVLAHLDITKLKALILGKSAEDSLIDAKPTFFIYTKRLIDDMKKAGQVGNARVYGGVLGALRVYLKDRDVTFEDITYSWLQRYETYYFAQGNSVNGLSLNMRTIRAIYNKAIREGLVERSCYPFHDYKIRNEVTEKRALDKSGLLKVVRTHLAEDHSLFHVRNYFLASYFMYGASFIDMAYLKVSNLKGGRVRYRRRKTHKLYDIKIEERLQSILDYYLPGKGEDDFLFPVVKRTSIQDQYREIDQARKMYNRGLKELAQLCGIEQHLTSYVSRHSFATQAMLSDIPINAISEMLGHSSLSTTQIYLKSLPSSILDEYHSRITLED